MTTTVESQNNEEDRKQLPHDLLLAVEELARVLHRALNTTEKHLIDPHVMGYSPTDTDKSTHYRKPR